MIAMLGTNVGHAILFKYLYRFGRVLIMHCCENCPSHVDSSKQLQYLNCIWLVESVRLQGNYLWS